VDSIMNKPRIGIPTPTSIDVAYNQRSYSAYADAILQAGGDPIQLDITGDFQSLAATCAGYLLPGSPADVDPTLYDTSRLEACGPADIGSCNTLGIRASRYWASATVASRSTCSTAGR
jgi:putative glutamine amidotransferase